MIYKNLRKYILNKRAKRKDPQTQEDLIVASGLFDPRFYLNNNKDIAISKIDPLEHYIYFGDKEGRSPSEKFNPSYYRLLNGEKKIDNALLHYINNQNNDHKDYGDRAQGKYQKKFSNNFIESLKRNDKVVVFLSMGWNAVLKQRPHHLAHEFSRMGFKVVYIDKHQSIHKQVDKNIFVFSDENIVSSLSGTEISRFFWLFSTTDISTKRVMNYKALGYKIIYDYIDDFDEQITRDLENQISNFKKLNLIAPDIVIASATNLKRQLEEKFKKTNKKQKVILSPNAVDVKHFDFRKNYQIPKDMKDIIDLKKPLIGYYGAIAPWLDYTMLNRLSKELSEFEFVYIGVDYNGGFKNLNVSKNVHYLGGRPYDLLPEYSTLFDCAIIPFQKGDIAKSTSPVKLYEYMAMGLPTVCTKDLNECKGYDYVYISKNTTEFKNNILKAVEAKKMTKTRYKLFNQAQKNTWESRAIHIAKEINRI